MRTMWTTLLAVALSVALASPAGAAVLCKRRSGLVAVRDACKATETQLNPVALGLQATPGPQGTPGTGPGLVLKDANGIAVGPFFPGADLSPDLVAITIGGRVAMLRLGSFSYGTSGSDGTYTTLGPEGVTFHYTSSDCTGTPLYPVDGSAVTSAAFRYGDVLYAWPLSGSPTTILSAEERPQTAAECSSQFASGGDVTTFIPPDRCCITGGPGFPTTSTEAQPLTLTTNFVPPFHVEVP